MGWLSGVLSGYMDRHHEYEAQEREDAARRAEQQGKIYSTLLNSDDPELKRMAATGILELGGPRKRKGGLAGWVGELETSPTYHMLEKYFQTPQFKKFPKQPDQDIATRIVKYEDPGGEPMIPRQPSVPPASGAIPEVPGTAAQQTTSPTQGTPLAPVQPAPQLQTPTGAPVTGPAAAAPPSGPPAPPQAQFPAPPPPPPSEYGATLAVPAGQEAQRTGTWAYPRYPNDVDLERNKLFGEADTWGQLFEKAGYPDPTKAGVEAVLAQHTRTTGAPYQAIAVEYEDETGRTVQEIASYNKYRKTWEGSAGQPLTGKNIRRARTALDLGDYVEQAALQLYGKRFVDLQGPERDLALRRANELRSEASYATGTGTGNAAFNRPLDIAGSQSTQQPVGTRASDLAPGVQPTPANQGTPQQRGATGPIVPRVATDFQNKSLAFYDRSQQANDKLSEKNTNDPNALSLEERIAQQSYLRQFQGELPAILQTSDQQAYRSYQRAFTEARLRAESGAAVPPHEYTNDQQTYFFVPGNTPEIMAQKRAMRQVVIDGLALESGPAYQRKYGAPYTPRAPNSPTAPRPGVGTAPPAPPQGLGGTEPPRGSWLVEDGQGGWDIVSEEP